MNRESALKILKDMLGDYKDNNLSKDKEAIEYAIKAIERTAPEVPVQEQSRFIPEDSNGKHHILGPSIERPY